MNILLINNFFFRKGGSETVFFNTGELLKKGGHTVHYFSLKRDQNYTVPDSMYFPDACDTKNFLKRTVSYFYNKDAASKLDIFLQDNRIDVAHIHLIWGGLSPSILHILKKHHIPIIHTAHDYRMLCPASTFLRRDFHICESCQRGFYLPCLFHRCAKGSPLFSAVMMLEMYFRIIFSREQHFLSGIIFVSEFSRSKHFQKNKHLKSIDNIRLYNFSPDNPLENDPITRHRNYDVFIGRLSPEKGITSLIQAWRTSGTNKELHIIGDGPQRSELNSLVKNISATNIVFEGQCDRNKVTSLLSGADYLILPSIWYENNPMTIIEAFSMHRPVIGMKIGGIPELIGKDRGFTIDYPASPETIAETLKEADSLSDEQYHRLQNNCYNFFRENFSSEEYFNTLISFYKKIIRNHSNEKNSQ